MMTIESRINLKGISGKPIFDFFLNCTDEDYQEWWEGTHLAFHTIKRYPDDLGNLVYFDEYIGKLRLKCYGVIVTLVPEKEIIWQMKKVIRLPAWLSIKFEDNEGGVDIIHTITAGYRGIGKMLDPALGLFFSDDFKKEMDEHAQTEFLKLRDMLSSK